MVIASSSSIDFNSLIRQCLLHRSQPQEFFSNVYQLALEHHHGDEQQMDGSNGIGQQIVQLIRQLPEFGSAISMPNVRQIETFRLSLDYLHFFYKKGVIDDQIYIEILANNLNNLSSSPAAHIFEIFQRLQLFTKEIQCSYKNAKECSFLFHQILNWHWKALEIVVIMNIKNDPQKQDVSTNNEEEDEMEEICTNLEDIERNLIEEIKQFRIQPFLALIIFMFHNEFGEISSQQIQMQIQSCIDRLQQNSCDSTEEGSSNKQERIQHSMDALKELADLFHSFSTPPSSTNWNPCKENFIKRRHRPAILTLASIYATFRVLKSADEVADSFLTMGQVFGLNPEQILEDILRAGFLIQLETSSSKFEALADVFVFLKIPQILSQMLEKGIHKMAILTALDRISECNSLLDELDAKKMDNVFRFFLDGLRKADVIRTDKYEELVAKRELKRNQNDELLHRLHNTPAQSASRSELISRVQKAKRGIDTSIDTSLDKSEELLRRLLSLGELPLDMLCCIYCASGELSKFSSKMAALNVQVQQQNTEKEKADSNVAGRLLIFDSTFLLMTRIMNVFPDMRLEELVGGRLHSIFYKWANRYKKCIEDDEQMDIFCTAINDQQFRTNFQQNQFQKMRQQKIPFWMGETADFGAAIETIPLLGELILNEFHRGQPESAHIFNIFSTFRQMSCLWLCLVQWLDTQKSENAKQMMARSMREFEANWAKQQQHAPKEEKDDSNDRLNYSMLLGQRLLHQMAEVRTKKEHPYTWLIGFAQRPLPALPISRKISLLRPNTVEIKEEHQRLKEVFLCANQQGWTIPDAIAHIDRVNKFCRMDLWLECWMRQMMNQQRVVTVDEGELAAELCLAATITYPVPCLCEMIKQLVETILFERSTNSVFTSAIQNSSMLPQQPNDPQQHIGPQMDHQQPQQVALPPKPPHPQLSNLLIARHPLVAQLSQKATVLAKMLVRAMQLLLWAGDRRALEKRERERKIKEFGIKIESNVGGSRKKKSTTCLVGREEKQQKMDETFESKEETVGKLLAESPLNQQSKCQAEKEELFEEEKQEKLANNKIGNNQMDETSTSANIGPSQSQGNIGAGRQPKDALKAQMTVRNVFDRFERILKECTLRPPVTFIIFFFHELGQASRTEYWHRLVKMVPVEMLFALARLDAPSIPLELFLSIYDPEDERNRKICIEYACLQRKFEQNQI